MFEKEAEEIANKRCHEIMCFGHCYFSSPKHHRCGEWHREYNCAKEGIEFGYNKGRNEAKEILKGLYFIIESRIDYKNNIGIADEMWRAKQFWSVEK